MLVQWLPLAWFTPSEYTVPTSMASSRLAYIVTALYTHITHLTHFIQGLLKEHNLQTFPILLHTVFPFPLQCRNTANVEQLLVGIFCVLCSVFCLLDSAPHGMKFLYYKGEKNWEVSVSLFMNMIHDDKIILSRPKTLGNDWGRIPMTLFEPLSLWFQFLKVRKGKVWNSLIWKIFHCCFCLI